MCVLQEKMSLHSVCACEFVFSNISSAPPLLEVGQRDISFHSQNCARAPSDPSLPVPAAWHLHRARCTLQPHQHGSFWGQDHAESCWFCDDAPLTPRTALCPPSRAIPFNQWVTIRLPCMIQRNVNVWWAWHKAANTQLEMAASEIRTAIFVTSSTGKWRAQQQHTASAELRLWRLCVSPWPCCPVGFVGWIQLGTWSQKVASSSSCPRGDILDEAVLMHGLSALWPPFSSPQQTHWIFYVSDCEETAGKHVLPKALIHEKSASPKVFCHCLRWKQRGKHNSRHSFIPPPVRVAIKIRLATGLFLTVVFHYINLQS